MTYTNARGGIELRDWIAEVTLNDELKFGVRWYMQKRSSSFTFSDAVNGASCKYVT